MTLKKPLVAKTSMLIRRPAKDCYDAFVDPATTSKFWFSDGSDRLDKAKRVTWTWAMYGVSTEVDVKELVPSKKIIVVWDVDKEEPTTIEWTFDEKPDGSTYVEIKNFGFKGHDDDAVENLVQTTDGFALVIAGAKAWLEHGLQLNLVRDKHPGMLVKGWKAG